MCRGKQYDGAFIGVGVNVQWSGKTCVDTTILAAVGTIGIETAKAACSQQAHARCVLCCRRQPPSFRGVGEVLRLCRTLQGIHLPHVLDVCCVQAVLVHRQLHLQPAAPPSGPEVRRLWTGAWGSPRALGPADHKGETLRIGGRVAIPELGHTIRRITLANLPPCLRTLRVPQCRAEGGQREGRSRHADSSVQRATTRRRWRASQLPSLCSM